MQGHAQVRCDNETGEIRYDDLRVDGDESIFLARMLEFVEPRVYQKKFPQYLARQLFPVSNEGGPGITTMTYRMFERIGIAQAISDYGKDFARVNLRAREFIARVKAYGNGLQYSQDELDGARYANVPLDAELAIAARTAYEARLEQVANQGDPTNGLVGYNSNPNVPIVACPTGVTSGAVLWTGKTADEIISDVSLLFQTMAANTNDIHRGNAFLLSPARDEIIQRLRLSNTPVSLKKYLEDTNPGLQIIRWFPMATASAAGAQRVSLYQRDPEVLQLREPSAFKIFPFQQDMLEWKAPAMGKTAGVVIRYPLACIHMDGC